MSLFTCQSKAAAIKKAGPAETNSGKDLIEEVGELLMDDTSASKCPLEKPQKETIEEIDSNDLLKQTNKMKESLNSAAFDENHADVSSGWKMVLHEESNQYYYWNVTTGETSWEVPDVLAQQTVQTSEENVTRDSAGEMDAVMGTNQSSTPLGTAEDDFTTRELSVHGKFSSEANALTKNSETNDCVNLGSKKDVSNDGCRSDTINVKEENRDANQDLGTSLLGGYSIECNNATDLSLQLVKQYESLLERLNSVKGYGTCNFWFEFFRVNSMYIT